MTIATIITIVTIHKITIPPQTNEQPHIINRNYQKAIKL